MTNRTVNGEIARLLKEAENAVEAAVSLARTHEIPLEVNIVRTVNKGPDDWRARDWKSSRDEWENSWQDSGC